MLKNGAAYTYKGYGSDGDTVERIKPATLILRNAMEIFKNISMDSERISVCPFFAPMGKSSKFNRRRIGFVSFFPVRNLHRNFGAFPRNGLYSEVAAEETGPLFHAPKPHPFLI